MSEYTYDLIVIGAGPGGYVGAIRASQLGMKTCIIEKHKVGGVCLNYGCIPSKSLIHQTEAVHSVETLMSLGFSIDSSNFDYKKMVQQSRAVSEQLSNGVNFLMVKNEITVINDTAVISGPNSVTTKDNGEITGKNILVATGSSPINLPAFPFDGKTIQSSKDILLDENLPGSICILGGGAIGCEFAHILSSLGVQVYIVEMEDHLLPAMDKDVSKVLERSFKRKKVKVMTSTTAEKVETTRNGCTVFVKNAKGKESQMDVDRMLVVVGRAPNSADLGLEEQGIEIDRGFVVTGDYYQTNVPSIYAIGDISGAPLLAHAASAEAEIAVEHMAGKKPVKKIDPMLIPGAVYTEPQLASFGLGEQDAGKNGISVKTASFPYMGAGKAIAIEKPEGFVKIITTEDGTEILGAQIVGTQATETIHELLLAKTAELSPEKIAHTIHAHPTISETLMEAAKQLGDGAIHV